MERDIAVLQTQVSDIHRRLNTMEDTLQDRYERHDQQREGMLLALGEVKVIVIRLEERLARLVEEFYAHREADAQVLAAVRGDDKTQLARLRGQSPWIAIGGAVVAAAYGILKSLGYL